MAASNYSFVFDFEKSFNQKEAVNWMKHRWTDTFYFNMLYVITIFSLKKYMENRPPQKMKICVVIWNSFLAIFSIIGTVRTTPELIHAVTTHGVHYSICNRSFIESNEVTRFWIFMFCLSKALELLDTVFVVLRKHPLIFLHWYHHMIALSYSWMSYSEVTSTSRLFCVMNLFVHSIMYSYFALRCLNIKVPKQVSITITSLQTLQMVIGSMANIYALTQILQGNQCDTTISNIIISLIIYMSLFILFSNFFHKSYIQTTTKYKIVRNTDKTN